ncbi:Zn-ribbon domain-containing OB-fold protein [Halobaculum rarum]|uniref:Zn-ribbon domain-containing OB-fold protein n=1 Tax=Halobaculum rarum TaxID=3075122 RepID=UPI0032AEF3B1
MTGNDRGSGSGADAGTTTDDPPADHAFGCRECGRRWYYTKPQCPDCGSELSTHTTARLGEGTVQAVTRVEVTPEDVRSPNQLALADFDGVRLIAQVAGDDDPTAGDRVAFAGSFTLRGGDDARQPRLRVVEDGG